jgi:hypothetical protein
MPRCAWLGQRRLLLLLLLLLLALLLSALHRLRQQLL